MLDLSEFLQDIHTKGFHDLGCHESIVDDRHAVLGNLKSGDAFYSSPFFEDRLNTLDRTTRLMVECVMLKLSNKFFTGLNHQICYNDLWCGVVENVMDFHNDYDVYNPQFTANVNVYLDNVVDGGVLQTSQDGVEVAAQIQPQRGQILVLNQKPEWLHKVTPCSEVRRLLSFRLSLPDLLPRT